MEIFKIENLNFSYPKSNRKAINNISFSVKSGEFITICGKSGSGKTTLLRFLKPSLSPFGKKSGNIYFKNQPLLETDLKTQSKEIGYVGQNPDNMLVTDKVWHELAFGLESLGYNESEIKTRVAEIVSFFGIESLFYKNVDELSGGMKQILNLASALILRPTVMILDEPTSRLDPINAEEFIKALEKINRELGITIIMTEHRLEEVFEISDRIIVMDNGKIISDSSPKATGEHLKKFSNDMFFSLPVSVRLWGSVENELECPVSVREGKAWLSEFSENHILNSDLIPKAKKAEKKDNSETAAELKNVYFKYEKNQNDILKGTNLKIEKGKVLAIMGGNGAGKSTLLTLICGLNKPYRGEIFINGEKIGKIKNLYNIIGVLPQNPQELFSKNTVFDELAEMISDLPMEKQSQKINEIATLCEISNLLKTHPYDLSGGEQQKAALAKVLLKNTNIILLDEPTKGTDAISKENLSDILANLKKNGVTIIIVSHDIEFCAENADQCAMLFDGDITEVSHPRNFFSEKSFYTTAASKIAKDILPSAVLTNDIISACGGKKIIFSKRKIQSDNNKDNKKSEKEETIKNKGKKKDKIKQNRKSKLFSLLFLLIFIPITIFIGTNFFDNKKYYFISLMIITETFIPFFLMFEKRKPKARELVVISVMSAIAVAGRSAFFMIPQFKPVTALVIISGISLGSESGFLIGALTGFISNFFFGQGPWTPWQMFAFGITGFISGLLFNNGKEKRRLTLSIYGFLTTLIVYGGIMNPASVLTWNPEPNLKMIISAYFAGFPFDLIHALSTAFFLWILSTPMIEKLERLKTKFGILS